MIPVLMVSTFQNLSWFVVAFAAEIVVMTAITTRLGLRHGSGVSQVPVGASPAEFFVIAVPAKKILHRPAQKRVNC